MTASESQIISCDNKQKAKTLLGSFDKPKTRHLHIKPQPQTASENAYFPRTSQSEDLSSLFDFDSPLISEMPKKPGLSKELSFGLSDGWDPLTTQPLSPPDSAAYSNSEWRPFEQYQPPPHNILTHIDPSRSRAQYGQTTPPDDEQLHSLESDLMLHDQQGLTYSGGSSTTDEPHHSPSSNAAQSANLPPKRVRKNGGRASKKEALDPNNPEDYRRSKFLERNRVAASKCRQKKKEWTNNLENRARGLQKENNSLHHIVDSCKEEILFLKGEMLKHSNCNCSEIQDYLQQGAQSYHGLPDRQVKKEASPVCSVQSAQSGSHSDHGHPQRLGYGRSQSRAYSEELSRAQSPTDRTLELLLTSQFTNDTSDEGIAMQISQ